MSEFTLTTPTQEPGFQTALEVVYQWSYDPDVEELRRLYQKATEAQWVAERDLDWDRPIDLEAFSTTPIGASLPVERTSYWRSMPREMREHATRKTASFRLSNFLHGEQGALMVAAQLVNAVPHTDAKFYAATQTMDEARHVEVFARYIQKLDEIRPISKPLKRVLDSTLETGDWLKKLVGMQVVIEGLALFSFKQMRALTGEPLLKELLTYVGRDESRHHAYGVQYVERCVPCLGDAERRELEDFALEAARTLVDNRNQQALVAEVLEIWAEAGIDVAELLSCLQRDLPEIFAGGVTRERLGPVQGFVIPTLRRCGLLSERVAAHYHDFLKENLSGAVIGETVEEFLERLPDVPADTLAWLFDEVERGGGPS